MSDKMNSIFNERECLSVNELHALLENNLPQSKQHEIEKHLLECEFCSDALEGLKIQNDSIKFKTDLKILTNKLNEFTEQDNDQSKIKVMFPWQMAAAFALLILSGLTLWFFLPKNNSEKLFTQEFKPYPITEQVTNPEIQSDLGNSINEKAIQLKTEVQEHKKNTENTVPESESKSLNTIPEAEITSVKENSNKKIATTETRTAKTIENEPTSQYSMASDEISSAKEVQGTKEVSSKKMSKDNSEPIVKASEISILPSFQNGLDAYKAGNFEIAIKIFELISEPKEALFYSGISYLSINKPNEALVRLKSYSQFAKPELQEATLWYESLTYINLKNDKQAKESLQKLIQLNGTYKIKAEQLLNKL